MVEATKLANNMTPIERNNPNTLETLLKFNESANLNASNTKGNTVYSGLGLLGKELDQKVLQSLKDLLILNNKEYEVSFSDLRSIATKVLRTIDYGKGLSTEFQQVDKKNISGLNPEVEKKLNTLETQISALAGVWEQLDIPQRSQNINKLKTATQDLVNALNPPSKPASTQIELQDTFMRLPR